MSKGRLWRPALINAINTDDRSKRRDASAEESQPYSRTPVTWSNPDSKNAIGSLHLNPLIGGLFFQPFQ
jgi:hypothetical protein